MYWGWWWGWGARGGGAPLALDPLDPSLTLGVLHVGLWCRVCVGGGGQEYQDVKSEHFSNIFTTI